MRPIIETLKAGDRCYFDSFAGLIPCRIVSIIGIPGPASSAQRIIAKATVNRNSRYGYYRGSIIEAFAFHFIPKTSIRRRKYSTVIVGRWLVQPDLATLHHES